MKRKLWSICFVVVIFWFIASNIPVYATGKEEQIVNIGYVEGYGAIRDIDSIDEKGYFYDLFQRMEYYSNYKFQFIEYASLDDVMEALERGEVEFFGPMFKTEEREEEFLYSIRIGTSITCLAVKPEQASSFYYGDPQSIDGKIVACYEGNVFEPYLDEYCKEHNIEVNYVRGTVEDYMNLEADMYLGASIFDDFKEYKSILNIDSSSLYVVTSEENRELKQELDRVYNDAISSDGGFLNELYDRYYADLNIERRGLTKEESELIQNTDFRIGFESNYSVFSYLNESGEADGIVVDIFRYAGERYGIKSMEFLPYQVDGEGDQSQEYVFENANVIISPIGKYTEFSENYLLSDTYMEIPMWMVASEDFYYSESSDARIGILRNAFINPIEVNAALGENEQVVYEDMSEIFSDFESGEIDGFLIDEYSFTYVESQLEIEYQEIGTEIVLPMKIWVSKEIGDDYVNIANVIFDNMDETAAHELILAEQGKYKSVPDVLETIEAHFEEFILIIILLVVTLVSFIGVLLLVARSRRTRAVLEIMNKDTITELPSSYHFNNRAREILQSADENEYEAVSIDIDKFSAINKYYGMEKGTLVIKAMAEALSQEFSSKDSLITRISAEHFFLIHPVSDQVSIERVCRSVLPKVIGEVIGGKYNLSLSVGVRRIENPKDILSNIFNRAIVAKNKGKDQYSTTIIVYSEEMDKEEENKFNVVYRMKRALEDREFFVKYQPKIDFETLTVCGAEALVRWKPRLGDGEIFPNDFIPVFEDNGFIVNLDLYVFEEVCRFISQNYKAMYVPVISVNLSGITLFEENIIDSLLRIIEQYKVHANMIEIEVTESAINIDGQMLKNKISELKSCGFAIAIDDFGAGVSSLNRISSIEADVLKLDKEFLNPCDESEKTHIVVEEVVRMAKKLNMKVVAEGVETYEQAEWLREIQCDVAQGYYFAQPVEINVFKEFLQGKKVFPVN